VLKGKEEIKKNPRPTYFGGARKKKGEKKSAQDMRIKNMKKRKKGRPNAWGRERLTVYG